MTITRFAPSPTGYLHLGNLRTALMNYLTARQSDGVFILRIDDTDQTRCKQEYVDAIKEDLTWLGIHWDRIEYQSKRLDRYEDAAEKLRRSGQLYEAFETATELDLKRKKQRMMGSPTTYDRAALSLSEAERDKMRETRGPGVWRFKLDHEWIVRWKDMIIGETKTDVANLSDPVLIRADGQFLYTLASVVDDVEMQITDVIRGSDHVTNSAVQIQIADALDAEAPHLAHHSLMTGPKGENLSKRAGSYSLRQLRQAGIEPMAILNYMAHIGTSHSMEIRQNMDELIEEFDLSVFKSAPVKVNIDDFNLLSKRYLQSAAWEYVKEDMVKAGIADRDTMERFWSVFRMNVSHRDDIAMWWDFCQNGADPIIQDGDEDFVAQAMALLPEHPFHDETWAEWTQAISEKTGRKGAKLFKPLRLAVTGRTKGPEMKFLMPMLQKVKARDLAISQKNEMNL